MGRVKKFEYRLDDKPESSIWEQFWIVAQISVPQILTTVAFQLVNLTSVYFIGHIGDSLAMASVGLGQVLLGTFCMAFCFGLNGTLEGKVSKAYGDRNYE